jgi:hypothetical protein
MYDNVVTSVRTSDKDTYDFSINIGLHQESILSPYLFVLVMNVVRRGIQGDIHWCMLFADDVVLVDESSMWVEQKLELWIQTLEAKDFMLSRSKIEYVKVNATTHGKHGKGDVRLDGQMVPKKDTFHYLGLMLRIGISIKI